MSRTQPATDLPTRVFLLSPARTTGQRAGYVLNDAATFDLALKIRSDAGASIGEVFSFLSGLYFRGKLAYARHFTRVNDVARPCVASGALVITSDQGLVCATTRITVDDLRRWSGMDISAENPAYVRPLQRDAAAIAEAIGSETDVVLLGSIATGKYVEPLLEIFGQRLKFPADFVGRGDMSRGGLLLRAVTANEELPYIPITGAVRKGTRPPKLEPVRRSSRPMPQSQKAAERPGGVPGGASRKRDG